LAVDALGAVAGGAASSSSNTVYIESAPGIAEGARTGLASVVTGLLFLAAMFLTPLYSVIPIEAAAPALVVVGALMIRLLRRGGSRVLAGCAVEPSRSKTLPC
jgi:AGZA family xanthine/uracil permease-like MFS transporter